MDMLSWNKLNPTVKIIPVNKLFYNKFLYKAKVYCPGGRSIYSRKKEDIELAISVRIARSMERNYNFGGSWYVRNTYHNAESLQKFCQISQLEYFFDVRQENSKNSIYIRVEEPDVSIYCNDEQTLYEIVSNSSPDRLREFHKPESESAANILIKGEILASKRIDFGYKIILKPIRLDDKKLKTNILNHLDNMADNVLVPKSFTNFLHSDKMFFQGGYIYSKDEHTAFLFNLAFSNLVRSIFKLTKLDS